MRILLAIDDTDASMDTVVQVAQWASQLERPQIRLLQSIPRCGASPEGEVFQEHGILSASQAVDKAKSIFSRHGVPPHSVDSVLLMNVENGERSNMIIKEARAGRFNHLILGSPSLSTLAQDLVSHFAANPVVGPLRCPESEPRIGEKGASTVYSLDIDQPGSGTAAI